MNRPSCRRALPLFEPLESRMLLTSATILDDQSALKAAQMQLNTDEAKFKATLADDQAQLRADSRGGNIASLQATLKSDTLSCAALLASDRTAVTTTRDVDQAAVLADQVKIRVDKGDRAALAADRARLAGEQSKLANDVKAAQATLAADTQSCNAKLAADRAAIPSAQRAASAAVQTDRQQIIADTASRTGTLANDQQAIIAARLKLQEDRHSSFGLSV